MTAQLGKGGGQKGLLFAFAHKEQIASEKEWVLRGSRELLQTPHDSKEVRE